MLRLVLFFAAALGAAAQTPSSDTPVLQALLTEIRQLRQDLATTAATIQRVQIVMFRVQNESQFLSRAAQRVDEAHNRCTGFEQQRRFTAQQIEQLEARRGSSQSPADQALADNIARMKASLESIGVEEQQCQTREIDATAQLRDEQAKMNDLQDQLDKLDKALSGGR